MGKMVKDHLVEQNDILNQILQKQQRDTICDGINW